ncbi:hypothetical protein AC1031_015365 [Aphanomyces cochlioides]|nr:hypothetical protein AC1031_015365 [Aphanomyces cochlioides]
MTDAPSATVPATCLICMDELAQPMNGVPGKRRQKTEYKPEDCWRLRCGHFYCVGCLNGWVESKVNERNVPIICASLDCKREVRPPHVAAVLGTALFEKFSELVAVKAFEAESMYCPNKACSHVFVKPSFRVGEEKTACLFCKTKICLRCQVQWHDGLDCDQYKRMIAAGGDSDEAQLHKLKEQHKWKQCPKCNILVERSIGCNFMRCKCGEHFCYECGVPYAEKIPSAGHPHGKVRPPFMSLGSLSSQDANADCFHRTPSALGLTLMRYESDSTNCASFPMVSMISSSACVKMATSASQPLATTWPIFAFRSKAPFGIECPLSYLHRFLP